MPKQSTPSHVVNLGQQHADNQTVCQMLGFDRSNYDHFYINDTLVAKWRDREETVLELFLPEDSEYSPQIAGWAKALGQVESLK